VASTVGGHVSRADEGGGQKEGDSMTIMGASPPGGAKDGESTIMDGS